VTAARDVLETQRKAEQDFVSQARDSEKAPKGWPAALIMFHMSMWRERLLHALEEMAEGRPQPPPPPGTIDEINDAELPTGIGTPLLDAAARSDTLFGELIVVYERVGDQPMEWNTARTTTEAVLRNSYIHARNHMFAYLKENGDQDAAYRLFEEAEAAMGEAWAPQSIRAIAMCNLAGVRAGEGRKDEALDLLGQALGMRPDMKAPVSRDAAFSSLHGDERFEALLRA
jgi:hypothetical protein